MQSKDMLPPGPKGLPFLGNVLQFRHDQLGYLLKLEQTYGRMATVYIGKTPIVLLFRPEHVRYVLVENPRNFTNREVAGGLIFGNLLVLTLLARNFNHKVTQGLHTLLGDGLLTTDGDFHRWHRRLLQPAFSKRRVENYADMIVQYTRETVERWQPGAEIDIARDLQGLILRMIMKILVDIDLVKQNKEVSQIIDAVLEQPVGLLEGLLNVQIDLPMTPYGKRMAAMRKADTYIYNLIDERLADKRDVGDILSILLQADAVTNRQVRDELVSLLAAGHETTTNTLAWTFYLLSQHPKVAEKVVAELQAVLGSRDPLLDDFPKLVYFDWVIKESMRLYPSAWTQGRQAIEAFDLDGYHFPAGTMLMFSQWVLHRLPDIWGDPEVFRPERWDPAHGQTKRPVSSRQSSKGVGAAPGPHQTSSIEAGRSEPGPLPTVPQWAYFPFGGGSRICMGMPLAQLQVWLVLAVVLQRYVPRLLPGHPVVPLPLITLRVKRGLHMKLDPTPALTPSKEGLTPGQP